MMYVNTETYSAYSDTAITSFIYFLLLIPVFNNGKTNRYTDIPAKFLRTDTVLFSLNNPKKSPYIQTVNIITDTIIGYLTMSIFFQNNTYKKNNNMYATTAIYTLESDS